MRRSEFNRRVGEVCPWTWAYYLPENKAIWVTFADISDCIPLNCEIMVPLVTKTPYTEANLRAVLEAVAKERLE